MATLVKTPLAMAASAISHVGWWLDWQTRHRVGQGARSLD